MAAAASRQTRNAASGPLAPGCSSMARRSTRPVPLRSESHPHGDRSKAGDRIYCIVRRWPADGRLEVPLAGAARTARVIGGPAEVPVRTVDGHPVVDLSGVQPPDRTASVVVLTVVGAVGTPEQVG